MPQLRPTSPFTLVFAALACLVLAIPTAAAQAASPLGAYGVDPASPIESRLGAAPADIVKMFTDDGAPAPTTHTLTPAEQRKLTAAIANLTPLHRRMLQQRLRSISFLDGLPNNALTRRVDAAGPEPVFDIIIRAGVLNETISELVTKKERTLFDADGSGLTVSINAGSMDGLVYALTHEATHVVDLALDIVEPAGALAPYTQGLWASARALNPRFQGGLLIGNHLRGDNKPMPASQAPALYDELRTTPFASVYASSNAHDDFAELETWFHLTAKLHQPYRIEIRRAGRLVASYEPMQAKRVRERVSLLERFYETP